MDCECTCHGNTSFETAAIIGGAVTVLLIIATAVIVTVIGALVLRFCRANSTTTEARYSRHQTMAHTHTHTHMHNTNAQVYTCIMAVPHCTYFLSALFPVIHLNAGILNSFRLLETRPTVL